MSLPGLIIVALLALTAAEDDRAQRDNGFQYFNCIGLDCLDNSASLEFLENCDDCSTPVTKLTLAPIIFDSNSYGAYSVSPQWA